jgi:hypothetical protein
MALGARRDPVYELRCPNCNTSAPPEMRRCIHCQGPLTTSDIATRLHDIAEADPVAYREVAERMADPSGAIEAEGEDAAPPRRGTRSLGVLWLLMAVAASVYRACAGAG